MHLHSSHLRIFASLHLCISTSLLFLSQVSSVNCHNMASMVLYSNGILDVMSAPYPQIASILRDDNYRKAMIEALVFQQCLTVFGGTPKLKAEKRGTDNIITWYLTYISFVHCTLKYSVIVFES